MSDDPKNNDPKNDDPKNDAAKNDDAKNNDPIAFFTDQYSQAVQALETIRLQAPMFMAMGSRDQLDKFFDQFIAMSSKIAADAHESNLPSYASWFLELVRKAEEMKASIDRFDAS